LVLLAAALCDARPSMDAMAHPALIQPGLGSFIVNGVPANPGEFPWQLSQQRCSGSCSHSCGASLLAASYALSAAHCVDGASAGSLRILAGLHERNNEANAVGTIAASYRMHEQYNQPGVTFSNDIAIITFAGGIGANGGSIQYAKLPDNNDNQYAGAICTISGWGRTDTSNLLPNVLQKADIQVIDQARCNQLLSPVSGASTGPGQICLYDEANRVGSCNGDSGGPLNCGGAVAGVTSWGMSSNGACLQNYPSVYSRTSFYREWIRANTP